MYSQLKKAFFGLLLGAAIGWWLKKTIHQDRRPVRGPSSRKVVATVFYDDKTEQHYRFRPVTHVCPPSVDIDALEHSSDDDDD